MNEPTSMTADFLAAFHKLDSTCQLILTLGIEHMAAKRMTGPQFQAWSADLFQRHRAGEELRVSDLMWKPTEG